MQHLQVWVRQAGILDMHTPLSLDLRQVISIGAGTDIFTYCNTVCSMCPALQELPAGDLSAGALAAHKPGQQHRQCLCALP
jgi:hypothetical protein